MIVGIDEVGRGCLAGPVVAGAVILRRKIAGVKDSKKLTRAVREKLDLKIRSQAIAYGIGWVSVDELDRIGLTAAVALAMHRALAEISVNYDEIIIDGNYNFMASNPNAKAIIKADDSVPAVSAASIIAKVARDRFMAQQSVEYPGYGFERHVGYGTAAHLSALQEFGACAIHRRCFKPIGDLLA